MKCISVVIFVIFACFTVTQANSHGKRITRKHMHVRVWQTKINRVLVFYLTCGWCGNKFVLTFRAPSTTEKLLRIPIVSISSGSSGGIRIKDERATIEVCTPHVRGLAHPVFILIYKLHCNTSFESRDTYTWWLTTTAGAPRRCQTYPQWWRKIGHFGQRDSWKIFRIFATALIFFVSLAFRKFSDLQ